MKIIRALCNYHRHTIPAQIERRHSNFCPGFFGAVAFKFEPDLTLVIRYLPQKVDFCSKKCQVPLYDIKIFPAKKLVSDWLTS